MKLTVEEFRIADAGYDPFAKVAFAVGPFRFWAWLDASGNVKVDDCVHDPAVRRQVTLNARKAVLDWLAKQWAAKDEQDQNPNYQPPDMED